MTTASRSIPRDVDEYVAAFPPEVRALLLRVRQVAREAAPLAQEVISYGMPALKQGGILVYYAAFKGHIGLYPPVTGDARLLEAVAPYAGVKGNLRFRYDEPIPFELISRIVRLRATADAARGKRAPNRRAKKTKLGQAPSAG